MSYALSILRIISISIILGGSEVRASATSPCGRSFSPSSLFDRAIDRASAALYKLEGQRSLRKDLKSGKLFDLENLILAYSTKQDEARYVELAQDFRALLSPDQTEALNLYTGKGSSYAAVSTFLNVSVGHSQTIPSRVGPARVSPDIPKLTQVLDSIFGISPKLPEGLLLFRGVSSNHDPIKIPRKGSYVRFAQFLSTSLDPESAHHFASYMRHDHRTIFVIKIGVKGIPGLIVGNTMENEIILPRNVVMRVDSKQSLYSEYAREKYSIVELTAIGQKFDRE